MKILHINGNYLFTSLHQFMIESLGRYGYENRVFVPMYDKRMAVVTPNENVIVSECFHYWDRLFFGYKQEKIQNAITKSCNVKDYDLIHAYTLFTDGNCAWRLSKKYGIPYVVAVRNTDVNLFFNRMPHLRQRGITIMQGAATVFFLSEAYRDHVFRKYIPQEYHAALMQKSKIIPNGIDDFWLQNTPTDQKLPDFSKEIRLIYAGRIDKNKNIPATQAAMKILRAKGYRVVLTVVGKVDDKKELESVQKDRYTTYLPAKAKDELITLYRQNHIFVMPSHHESFGLVYAEAMSQGLPVVYTKGQGFDRQFPEGDVGYHVSDISPEEIAAAIMKIIGNYEEISSRCVDASKKFSWNDICHQYHETYQLIEEKKCQQTGD